MASLSRLGLAGKVALVTGASRGIGAATALALAHEGARLALAGRDVEQLKAVAARVVEAGAEEPLVLAYDVTAPDAVRAAFQLLHRELGRLDVLVNNAGVLEDALLGMVTPAQIDRVFAVNTTAVITHMQYASRLMARRRAGSVVNVASIIGRVGNEGQVVYGASKAAVIGATLSAAKELAPTGIRVNAVAPGFIETDMVRALPPDKRALRQRDIKMGRVGTPEDVADVILFLASDLSRYVTGQVLGVDGGMLV